MPKLCTQGKAGQRKIVHRQVPASATRANCTSPFLGWFTFGWGRAPAPSSNACLRPRDSHYCAGRRILQGRLIACPFYVVSALSPSDNTLRWHGEAWLVRRRWQYTLYTNCGGRAEDSRRQAMPRECQVHPLQGAERGGIGTGGV